MVPLSPRTLQGFRGSVPGPRAETDGRGFHYLTTGGDAGAWPGVGKAPGRC